MLREQIFAVLADERSLSVRHVFYRMTDPTLPELVEKTDRGYSQVQYQMTRMRREGLIPYAWITDATRRGFHVDTFTDGADFVRRAAVLYRADLWRSAGCYVEVWCESRSIAGMIEADCEELAVSLYPAGGFASITLAHQAAEYINAATGKGQKPAHIIYIGDYDPAGVIIDRAIEAELRKHLDPAVNLAFHRIAINPDQIATYRLPTKPRKASDRRMRDLAATVEAEAMPARILRAILREKIEAFLPPDALRVAKVAEASEKEWMTQMADMFRSDACREGGAP